MTTTKPEAAAAARIGARLGARKRRALLCLLRPCFARPEPWLQAGKYVNALASGLPRRNGWTITEHAGDRAPDRTQRLLNRASWDTFAAMGTVRRFAVAALEEAAHRSGRRRGLVIGALDETGQEKQGAAKAGVQRQYLGCAGRVANGINTVHLAYVREHAGHALIGSRQWIPGTQIEDPVKALAMACRQAWSSAPRDSWPPISLPGHSRTASGSISPAATRSMATAPNCAPSSKPTARHTWCASRGAETPRAAAATGRSRPIVAQPRPGPPSPAAIETNGELRQLVAELLAQRWSPQQISRNLRLKFPGEPEMWLFHESIYQALYQPGSVLLRPSPLATHHRSPLRTGRDHRRAHQRAGRRRPRFEKPMLTISQRPFPPEDRSEAGHWEGDLIIGKDQGSAIGTLVERQTRMVLLLHMPQRDGDTLHNALKAQMAGLPPVLLRSITRDQGTEMARHRTITRSLGAPVYFCDSHSPWQRGSNETPTACCATTSPRAPT